MNDLTPLPSRPLPVPALVAAAGEQARVRFLEFFAANIRNPHTRAPTAARWASSTGSACATIPRGGCFRTIPHPGGQLTKTPLTQANAPGRSRRRNPGRPLKGGSCMAQCYASLHPGCSNVHLAP